MRIRLVILAALALNGCSETEVQTYQGRPAQTALECEAAYQAANSSTSGSSTYDGTRASLIGTVIGLSLVQGMRESNFKTCLARVANTVPGSGSPVPGAPAPLSTPATPARQYRAPSGCIPGGGPMQGGTSYCIGQ